VNRPAASASTQTVNNTVSTRRRGKTGLIKPATPLITWMALWLAAAALIRLAPTLHGLWQPWLWLGTALGVAAIYDLWILLREQPTLELKRQLPANWPVNSAVKLALDIACRDIASQGQRRLKLTVHELFPASIRATGMPQGIVIAPGEQHRLHWRATPLRRGEVTLPGCHLAWRSPLGLWWRRRTVSLEDRVKVYPNFNLVIQYGMLAGDRRLGEMGIHLAQRRGTGSDFHQLRDFRDGDTLRQVDWHATARMRKLIARDYQEERDQRVVFLLDCSRRMRAMDGTTSHFDQCLNAMLLLSHVALKQGDEIALHTIAAADGRERILPAGRGQRQFGELLESVFDLEAGLTYPDFLGAAGDLMSRQRRRSLVVLLTNLRDEDHEELDPALALLRQRHLVLLADLREQVSEVPTATDRPRHVSEFDQTLLQAGQTLYREQRKTATHHLRQLGIIHLDVVPQALPGALVSQYRTLKAGGIF